MVVRGAPRRKSRASQAPKEFPDETLIGVQRMRLKGKQEIEINVAGFTIDKTATRSLKAETFLFKPPARSKVLPCGFTHVARRRKRGTGAISWKLVNAQRRTVLRSHTTTRARDMSSATEAKGKKKENTALIVYTGPRVYDLADLCGATSAP